MAGQPMLDEYSNCMNNMEISSPDIQLHILGASTERFCLGAITITLLELLDRLCNLVVMKFNE